MFTVPTTLLAPAGIEIYSTESLNFNGSNQYMELANATDLQFGISDTFTISFWAKPSATPVEQILMSTRRGGKGISITSFFGSFTVYISTGGDTISFAIGGIAAGTWGHFALTYDGSGNKDGFTGYSDNSPLVPSSDSLGDWSNTNPWRIGWDTFGTNYLGGNVDELIFSDAELTAGQISSIYNGGLPADPTGTSGMIHNYRMGEGDTIPTILDPTGSANGTTYNSPVIQTDAPP